MEEIEVFWGYNTLRAILGRIFGYRAFFRGINPSHIRFAFHATVKKLRVANHQLLSINTGFTLIELITAIGILAILASTAIAVINPLEQFQKSQDAKRKADLAQIQRGLEVYYQDYHRYPPVYQKLPEVNLISTDGTVNTAVDWGNAWNPYMNVLPIDPKGAKSYEYWTDATGQSYAIYAALDRGDRDKQACNSGRACTGTDRTGISGGNIMCGAGIICNYGVTSPNIAP